MGPVSPLLAIFEELKTRQPDAEFLWLATRNGSERELVASYGMRTQEIFSGKFRRYFSVKNIFDPLLVALGFVQSFFIILKFKPHVVLSAGGFVSVPVAWAAWLLRKPVMIHQQDVEPGLANKLMAPVATVITTAFASSALAFPSKKTTVVGNPVRASITHGSGDAGLKFLGFDSSLPVVLVMGGGTGAQSLNDLVVDSLEQLVAFCQVVHLTGGKLNRIAEHRHYRGFTFLTNQLADVFAAADLVVTRAGMSALTEVAALGKAAIIIPMPGTHQEVNANEFLKINAAAVVDQQTLTRSTLVAAIQELLGDSAERATFARNAQKVIDTTAAKRIVDMIV